MEIVFKSRWDRDNNLIFEITHFGDLPYDLPPRDWAELVRAATGGRLEDVETHTVEGGCGQTYVLVASGCDPDREHNLAHSILRLSTEEEAEIDAAKPLN